MAVPRIKVIGARLRHNLAGGVIGETVDRHILRLISIMSPELPRNAPGILLIHQRLFLYLYRPYKNAKATAIYINI